MKKSLLILLVFLSFMPAYSFEIADQYSYDLGMYSNLDVSKEGNRFCFRITTDNEYIHNGKKIRSYTQIKTLNDFKLQKDGWYEVDVMGLKLITIFGGNYFFFHENNNKYLTMYDKNINYEKCRKEAPSFENIVYYHYDVNNGCERVKNIILPDSLTENVHGKRMSYDNSDMMCYYCYNSEYGVYCNPSAIPWATSKNPIGMKIKMEFHEAQDTIDILNGFCDPYRRHLYKANRRLKKIWVTSSESDFSIEREIEDVVHFEEIKLPVAVSSLEIEILDFYEGEKYRDTCVQMFGIRFTPGWNRGPSFERLQNWGAKPWNGEKIEVNKKFVNYYDKYRFD